MSLRKKLTQSGVVAAVVAIALSGCSTAASTSEATSEARTITIGTSNDAPFSYTDDSGNLVGIDGEVWNEIAKCNGWNTKVYVTDFSTLIPSLQSKKIDVIVDAMYITDERKKTINFTNPWYVQGEGLVVGKGTGIKSRDDLKGKVVGAQTGTAFVDLVNQVGASETKFFDSQAALIAALENGQIDAAITDQAVVAWNLVQKPSDKIELVTPYEAYFPGIIGAGVRKEDTDILDGINKCLTELQGTPNFQKILEKYGLNTDNLYKG